VNQKRKQAGTPGGVGGQFAEQRRPEADSWLGAGVEFPSGAEVVGRNPDGGRPVIGVVEGNLGFEDDGLSAYVRVNDPGSERHGRIRVVPIRDLALSGDSRRLFDKDLSRLHEGLDEGVAVTIDDDSASADAGLPGVIETPPYGTPGDMWTVIRIDKPGHPDHDTLRSVPADDISPRAAEPAVVSPDIVDIDSATGDPVLAVFNDDDTLDIQTSDGSVRISIEDIAKLADAAAAVRKRQHRATIVQDARVEFPRPGLASQYGTVVGSRQNGDWIEVRYDDGRVLTHEPERLRAAE
jgi:class 3 adenylate cyclase